mgnify:CR=1 FL=1
MELHNFYGNVNIKECLNHVDCSGHGWDGRRAHKFLAKLEGNHPPGRPRIRWEDNIIWNLKEVMRVIGKYLSKIG